MAGERFAGRLAEVAERTWEGLRREGRLRGVGPPPVLEMPRGFARTLAAALDLEQGGARAQVLEEHYLRFLPAMRVELWGTRDAAAAPLFAPLRWERMGRVTSAMARLRQLLGPALEPCLPPAPALAAEAPCYAALFERTLYGRYLPPLCAWPSDLQRLQRIQQRAPAREEEVEETVERHLGAALVHELSHGAPRREPLDPPYLDECIAAYLGALALPESAFPAARGPAALFAAPWLVQVGQALARVVGLGPLCQAHGGAAPWEAVLPEGLYAAARRLGLEEYQERRDPHFLSSSFAPEPWLKLLFFAGGGGDLGRITLAELRARPFADIPLGPGAEEGPLDEEILDFGLRAMGLRARRADGGYAVAAAVPGPLRVDLEGCLLSRASVDPDDPCSRAPVYLFPPALARRLRGRGHLLLHLHDGGEETRAALRTRLLAGAAPGAGPGYEIR